MIKAENGFFKKIVAKQNILFCGFLLCELCFLILMCFMHINEDEIEHIHASWLVWEGYIPYKDFFEHHNPLLWYLFAPLTALFYDNVNIVYFVNFLALIVNSATFYMIYKILQRCTPKALLVLCLTLIFCLAIAPEGRESFVTFRPDIFMNLCFFSGVLMFLRYTDNHQCRNLIISFALFTLSFFFLQKIVFLLICIGCEILYCLYKKIILPRDFFISLLLPLLLCGGFILYLTFYDLWADYFLLNIQFNSLMIKYWGLSEYILKIADMRFSFDITSGYDGVHFELVTIIICIFALMCLPTFVRQGGIYAHTLALLFVAELICRILIFSPHMYYFLVLHILAALICFTILCRQISKATAVLMVFLFVFYTLLGIRFLFNSRQYIESMNKKMDYFRYVIANSGPDDIILSGYQYPINLFRRDADYTWFLLSDVSNVYNQSYRAKSFDINRIIRDKKPKILIITEGNKTFLQKRLANNIRKYNKDLLHLMAYTHQDYSSLLLHQNILENLTPYHVNKELLRQYYEPTEIENIWLRKSENSE